MINIKRHELKQSYIKSYNFYKQIDGYQKSKRLVLFYAVECGLKSLLLLNISKNTTNDLFRCHDYQRLEGHGHDIKAMLDILGCESSFHLKRIEGTIGRFVEPCEYNQMWRYGLETSDQNAEQEAENTLVKIAEWLTTKL